MPAVLPQLDLSFDPLGWAVIVGLIWPTIQAALDRPTWTRSRRLALVIIAGIILSLALWFAGAYPLTAQLIWSQASVIIATATVAFALLKKVGVIDWIGRVTPGGETRVIEGTATAESDTPTAAEQEPIVTDAGGVTAVPNTDVSSLEHEDHTA